MRVALALAVVVMISGSTASRISMPGDYPKGLGDLHPPAQHGQINSPLRAHIQLAQVQYDNKCFTPTFWCYLPQAYPVGTRCWCATPSGAVQGVVR
jgi:hypothetical protein